MEQVIVFLLVGIDDGFLGFVCPSVFPGDGELVPVVDHLDGAERSMGAFCDVVEAAWDLAVLDEHAGAVGVFVFDGEVIEDASGFFPFTHFGAGHAHGADGVSVLDPVDDVDVMKAHIDVDVAALPGEVELVVELVLEFVPFGAAWEHGSGGAHVPEGARVVELADGSVLDPFDGFEVTEFVTALEADTDFEVLFLGVFCCSENAPDSDGIEGDRFFHEDVFSLFDGFLEHGGAEGARGGEDDDVTGGDGLFVSLESEEDPFFWNIHFVAVLSGEILERFLNLFVEEFGDCDEFDVGAGFEGLVCGAGGTSAAADHGQFERACLALGVGESLDGESGEG